MSDVQHPFQVAFDSIKAAGGSVGQGQKAYRVLHKLTKAKGVYMHGSEAFIGKVFSLSRAKINKMAKDVLLQYCRTGLLQVPDEFKYNDKKQYRHDGDGHANRNLWRESNKAAQDAGRAEPVQYSYNTVKP